EDGDRWVAQSLLDYWSTTLDRVGRTPPESVLADFDATLAPVLPDHPCPYRGLDAFSVDDRRFFFGRDRMIEELVSIVRAQRLVAVIGSSGSGKSSLVRACLLPALRGDDALRAYDWRFVALAPGSDPLGAWERALAQLPPGPGPALVVVDQ